MYNIYQKVKETLIKERERLFKLLKDVPFLNPYPSYSNFILCEVTSGMDAKKLKVHILFPQLTALHIKIICNLPRTIIKNFTESNDGRRFVVYHFECAITFQNLYCRMTLQKWGWWSVTTITKNWRVTFVCLLESRSTQMPWWSASCACINSLC